MCFIMKVEQRLEELKKERQVISGNILRCQKTIDDLTENKRKNAMAMVRLDGAIAEFEALIKFQGEEYGINKSIKVKE